MGCNKCYEILTHLTSQRKTSTTKRPLFTCKCLGDVTVTTGIMAYQVPSAAIFPHGQKCVPAPLIIDYLTGKGEAELWSARDMYTQSWLQADRKHSQWASTHLQGCVIGAAPRVCVCVCNVTKSFQCNCLCKLCGWKS